MVRARLSDALYFWQTDQADLPDVGSLRPSAEKLGLTLSKPLDQRMAKLDALGVTFHAKLGTQGQRVERIAALAETIAATVYPDGAELGGESVSAEALKRHVKRAALLAKADLTTEAVGEFPELQGLMGRYYAALQGEHPSVQAAIEEHYKPLGPGDQVPTDPVAICVSLADKLDMMVGFWAIDEKPTGSKDPYALRRAALGVVRILTAKSITLRIEQVISTHFELVDRAIHATGVHYWRSVSNVERERQRQLLEEAIASRGNTDAGSQGVFDRTSDLLAFFHDRLKVQLRDSGARHDLVDAVM